MVDAEDNSVASRGPRMLALGVTGHRFLADVEGVTAGVEAALNDLDRRYPGRRIRVYSSLAEGADQLVASAVLERPGAELVVVLPLPVSDYEEDFRSEAASRVFHELLRQAASVIVMPPVATREAAYAKAGGFVIDHCGVLLAVWDGQAAQGEGGTGETVALARAAGKPIAWVRAGNRRAGSEEPVSLGAEQGRYEWLT